MYLYKIIRWKQKILEYWLSDTVKSLGCDSNCAWKALGSGLRQKILFKATAAVIFILTFGWAS